MDTCIYHQSTRNVYAGRCEDCAVIEYDNDNAHGASPASQSPKVELIGGILYRS